SRLIMVFRVKENTEENKKKSRIKLDSRFVYLKTFKDIPESDVEILLPGSKIRLTKMDRAKILFPTLSGMAITIYKISRSALLLGLAFSWSTVFGLTVLIGGSIGYLVKSVMSYFRTKNDYQSGLTKNLYLKNLDNNLGVLYRILNEAEEQEVSETILAYAVLWKHPDFQTSGARFRQLDEAVEAFIKSSVCSAPVDRPMTDDDDCSLAGCDRAHLAADVDFEVHDALGKLARLGLANVGPRGYWQAVPIEQAIETIAKRWKNLLP
ncbi:TMEM143 family protein, partial [Mariniblastus sp.]|nr:TMEM143 family protein [Mariniblastus sp.]